MNGKVEREGAFGINTKKKLRKLVSDVSDESLDYTKKKQLPGGFVGKFMQKSAEFMST
jgi:hypothetical protein